MSATSPASLTAQVPLSIRRRPGRKMVVTLDGKVSAGMPATAIPTRADPALVRALARAFRYQSLLDEGQYASISEMAKPRGWTADTWDGCCSSHCWRRASSKRFWMEGRYRN